MKKMTENLKNFLFVIVLLCFASNMFANDSRPRLKIINGEKKLFTLVAENDKSTSATIRIFDEQRFNLLKERIVLDGRHSKSYDLSNLPKGTYEVEIEDNTLFRKYIVTITFDNLQIVENDADRIYKPVLKLDEKVVLFNMLNLNSKDISFAINNESGEEIYVENIQDTKAIHRSYNISNLITGKYLFIINSPTKIFNFEFDIK